MTPCIRYCYFIDFLVCKQTDEQDCVLGYGINQS
jgi:hypothetical protein